jgi:zinc/manganese transport system permease protein
MVFLTEWERDTHRDAVASIQRATAEVRELQEMKTKMDWGEVQLTPDMADRVRQTLAGRTEMAWGDRLVLRTLREKARVRQRFVLGVPLLLGGIGALIVSGRRLGA